MRRALKQLKHAAQDNEAFQNMAHIQPVPSAPEIFLFDLVSSLKSCHFAAEGRLFLQLVLWTSDAKVNCLILQIKLESVFESSCVGFKCTDFQRDMCAEHVMYIQ